MTKFIKLLNSYSIYNLKNVSKKSFVAGVFGSRMINWKNALKGNMPYYKFVGNKVLIGVVDGEWPIRGFLKAIDLHTGKLIWTFFTIPDSGQEGIWATKDATGHDLNRNIEKEKKLSNVTQQKNKLYRSSTS